MSAKEDQSRELAELMARHLEQKPESVTLYAPEAKPERRPWRKRPSLLDEAFAEELAKASKQNEKDK